MVFSITASSTPSELTFGTTRVSDQKSSKTVEQSISQNKRLEVDFEINFSIKFNFFLFL
jgi:hypothetical protein